MAASSSKTDKNNHMKQLIIPAFAAILFASCTASLQQSSTAVYSTADGNVRLLFENYAGLQPLTLNKDTFNTALGERMTVSLLQYYITNISLKKTDGSILTIPQDQSYFLIKESDPASREISLNIPEGKYESVSFVLGVDSLRNTKPIAERTGVLDPATGGAGMYWSWNSGYIFFKMEGYSPVASPGKNNDYKFRYHIGLFGGMNTPTVNNVKTITLPLDKLKISEKKPAAVHIHTDILKMFSGVNDISIAKNTTVMVTPFSAKIADNFTGMFTVSGIDQ